MAEEISLLTEREAADFLAMEPGTLRVWRYTHSGPPWLKLATGAVRYNQADLVAWAFERRVDPSEKLG